jgi:ABC-type nitrate/sulfonate/bicarbonate transport system substrate-binding protein
MTIDNLSQAALTSSLIANKIQGALVFPYVIGPEVTAAGVAVHSISFGTDPAFNQIYNAYSVSATWAHAHPALLRNIVKGFDAALAAARAHPIQAAQAEIAAQPLVAPTLGVTTQQVESFFKYIRSPNDTGKPYGWMSSVDWKLTEAFAKDHEGYTGNAAPTSVYTDKYFSS